MKKIIFIVIAIILGLSSCHDDDYITGVPSFGPPEVNNMAERVNGQELSPNRSEKQTS